MLFLGIQRNLCNRPNTKHMIHEKEDRLDSCATFHTYNVMTQHRTTIDPPQHTIEIGRAHV